jgi:hypothetical protein
MPNGDTVQIQMPDGRILTGPRANLPIALRMGAKLYDPSRASVGSPAREGSQIGDFGSSLWKQVNPANIVKGMAEITSHPISMYEQDAARRQALVNKAKQEFSSGNYGPAAAEGLYGSIPFLGPQLEKAGEQISGGQYGKGLGTSVGIGLLSSAPEIGEVGGSLAGEVLEAPRSAVRDVLGVSDKDIEPILKKNQQEMAAIDAKYQRDVAQAHSDYAEKVDEIRKQNIQSVDEHTAAMAKARQEHEQQLRDIDEKNQQALQKHEDKVSELKAKAASKIAARQARSVEASKASTEAETRRAALVTKSGPVFKRMANAADNAQENVRLVDQRVRALETARWNALSRKVGNTPVEWTPVQKAVSDAEDSILKGSPENIAIFRNIMKEGEGGEPSLAQASVFRGGPGIDVKEFISSIKDPIKKEQFIKEMSASGALPASKTGVPAEGATVPLDTARGFSTELGQKIYGRDLPGDVRRALHSVQDAIENETVKTIAKSGGKDAVIEYRGLRSRWRDYMQTFYDKDSPIRKLKEAQDPNDKLRPIVGDEGQRAIQLFGKYKDLGADVTTMGKLRGLNKALRSLRSTMPAKVAETEPNLSIPEKPKASEYPSVAKVPEAPQLKEYPQPNIPQKPTVVPLTAKEARLQKLESSAKFYSHPPSRWEVMFPGLLVYKLFMKHLLDSGAFRDWVADGGGPVAPPPPSGP